MGAGSWLPRPKSIADSGGRALPLGRRRRLGSRVRLEPDLAVGAVAERLALGVAAAAEGDDLRARQLELVPFDIDQDDRALDAVGAVQANGDPHLFQRSLLSRRFWTACSMIADRH